MKKYLRLILAVSFCITAANVLAQSAMSGLNKTASDKDAEIKKILQYYDKQIYFTENKGQWPVNVLYRADFPLGQAVATKQGMMVGTFDAASIAARNAQVIEEEKGLQNGVHKSPEGIIKGHGWMMNFVNSSPSMSIESNNKHRDVFNYIHGNSSPGAMGANNFQEIWYKDVYKQVDVRYYPSAQGALEYDIIAKPGFDKNTIALRLDGIDQVSVKKNGHLVLQTSVGGMDFPAPVAYQIINGKRIAVEAQYELAGNNEFKFKLGQFDASQPLVIDPIALRWATWITNNSQGGNHGHCIWVDKNDGSIYVAGRIMGTGLITVGAIQQNYTSPIGGSDPNNFPDDLFIGKYIEPSNIGDPGIRVWQTYLGGSKEDNPLAMEQGPDGFLYICGYTSSVDFPLSGGDLGGTSIDDRTQKTDNGFVLKFSTDGQSYKASVIGGNKNDWFYDLRITKSGDIIACGYSASTNLADLFPGSGATDITQLREALVFRINPDLSGIVWMKNFGGAGDDYAQIMLNDTAASTIYVGGQTWSSDFPTLNPRQSSFTGKVDGWIRKMDYSGNTLWSSYFNSGSNDSTAILCMEFNNMKNKLYFGGVTTGLASSNISASGVLQSTYGGGTNDYFVTLMDTDQTLEKSTYLGGRRNEVNMMGLNVDQNSGVFIFGYSNSTDFPVTTDALQTKLNTTGTDSLNSDKTFTKLDSTLSTVLYSTYYGGTDDDYDPAGERGIKFSGCRIYTIVTSASNDVPLTEGAINTIKLSTKDTTSNPDKPISGNTYEPGLVVWANPPDLIGNTISGNQNACAGSIPAAGLTGSVASYGLPNISRNGVISAYPVNYNSSVTYQWQSSTDTTDDLLWTDVAGGNTQNLAALTIGPLSQKTFYRRIIGGDACQRDGGSIITIGINPTYDNTPIEATTCDNVPYTLPWGGTGVAGDNMHTYTTGNGCDSVVTIHLTINPTYNNTPIQATTCDNVPYPLPWGGTGVAGDNIHTYPSVNSCDSVVTIHLTIKNTSTSSTDHGACDNYFWNGTTYTSTGSYVYHTTNAAGCDSAATLNLTITTSTKHVTTAAACDSYTWNTNGNGQTYTQSGHYAYVNGCVTDSLYLTITTSTKHVTTAAACDSYTWNENGNGQTYTQSGHYAYVNGCVTDSLYLTITTSTKNVTTAAACDSYTWNTNGNGQTYTQSGHYAYVNGCVTDSLYLTITTSTKNVTTAAACDSYTWNTNGNGQTYTQSGHYAYVNGCVTDSLYLTITTSTKNVTTAAACDSYTWNTNGNGQTYTQSGHYAYVNGCVTDSLYLTITTSTKNVTTAAACDSYTWNTNGNGQTYTQSGHYVYVNGCVTDSLYLTITTSTKHVTTAAACDSYTWNTNGNGQTYTQSGHYVYVNGCVTDSLYLTITTSTKHVTTAAACDSYTWNANGNDQTYTQSGHYAYVNGCVTDSLYLTITKSSTSSTSQTSCTSYTWNGTTYTSSGNYVYHTTNAAGCDSAATLHLTISSCGLSGCTLGFWKNHTSIWRDPSSDIPECLAAAIASLGPPYSGDGTSGSSFASTFGLSSTQMMAAGLSPSLTLLQALQSGGGGFFMMARQGTASLINGCSIPFQYTSMQVITTMHQGIISLNSSAGNLFAAANETQPDKCPSGGPAHKRFDDLNAESDNAVIAAYPNPFNDITNIEFAVNVSSSRTVVDIYNVSGEKVVTLFDGVAEPGQTYTVRFDGTAYAQGVYFTRVTTDNGFNYEKLILIK